MSAIHRITASASMYMRHNRLQRNRAYERLASGKKINRASDDAAGLAIAARMSAQISSRGQGMRNLHDGISLSRVAEGALSSSTDLLGRMRELTIQGQNGILSDSDRASIQQEYDALSEELTRISASTEFNGKRLLDGSLTGSGAVTIDNGQGADVSGTEIEIADASAAALGVGGQSVGNPDSTRRLDLALESVLRTRAGLGSVENRLLSQVSQLGVDRENGMAARSRIEDADYAVEFSDLVRSDLLEKSQISLQVQSRQASRRTLLELLRSQGLPRTGI